MAEKITDYLHQVIPKGTFTFWVNAEIVNWN